MDLHKFCLNSNLGKNSSIKLDVELNSLVHILSYNMLYKILSIVSVVFSYGSSDPITGGVDVGKVSIEGSKVIVTGQDMFPFMAHLAIKKMKMKKGKLSEEVYSCGGVIIREDAVLTAGHCLKYTYRKPKIFVRVGMVHFPYEKDTAPSSWASKFVINEGYLESQKLDDNLFVRAMCDIAIVWLDTSLRFGYTVNKAVRNDAENNLVGKQGLIIGWGLNNNGPAYEMLQMAATRVISYEDCKSKLPEVELQADTFCVLSDDETKTTGVGDSGGPFVIDGVVYGILSFGLSIDVAGKRMAYPEKPSIYTNIVEYKEWIEEKFEEKNNPKRKCARRYDDAVKRTKTRH